MRTATDAGGPQFPDRKIPPMPTTTTHGYPNVPLPTGVAAVDDWHPNDPLPYRVVLGAGRGVTDHNAVVQTVAIQFADGRIDDGRIEAPTVTISRADYNGRGLSSTQARELAAVLLEAADELDGWIESSQAASRNRIALVRVWSENRIILE
jgi:hypothetical protein